MVEVEPVAYLAGSMRSGSIATMVFFKHIMHGIAARTTAATWRIHTTVIVGRRTNGRTDGRYALVLNQMATMALHWGASFVKSITTAHVARAIAGGRAFFSMQPMCGMR